ncbi:MAG: hypothetical protein ABI472_16240 [Ginsengibacter sp.]
MINPARLKISEHQHILAAGIRLLEQYKLSLGAGKRKKKDTPVNFIEEYIKQAIPWWTSDQSIAIIYIVCT